MMLTQPMLPDVRFLCERARHDEIVQWEALTGQPWDPALVAVDLMSRVGPKFMLVDGTAPIVAAGLEYVLPGVWQGWMVGTPRGWESHWREITLAANRVLRRVLRNERRVEILALASRTRTCEWYERGLRMQREGVKRGFGVNGEDAVLYARVRKGEDNG